MAQYRKKPVVIEAEQFFYDGPRVRGVFYPDVSEDGRTWIGDAFVVTIHDQRVYLQSGDWVIAEPDGEHYYPVKPDIFAATYDPLEGDMFARGEMASSLATPERQVSKLSLSESEQLELMVIISRLQLEHSDLIERERVLEAEAADLRRQLAEAQAWGELQTATLELVTAERDDLRRQLADVPREEISTMYDAYAHAVAGMDNAAEFPAVGRWLGVLPPPPPPPCGAPGFTGFGACYLPAGHDGPHAHLRLPTE